MDDYFHRLLVKDDVTAARALIECRLGVETVASPAGREGWTIDFLAPRDVDLDFLRPDVLPPR